MFSSLPCFLFRDMVRDFHRPSLCRLADDALPTPEPRSKFTFTLPSDSSRDMKSFYRGGHGEKAVRYWSGNTFSKSSAITSSFRSTMNWKSLSCQATHVKLNQLIWMEAGLQPPPLSIFSGVTDLFSWQIMCCLAFLIHLGRQCLHCQKCFI